MRDLSTYSIIFRPPDRQEIYKKAFLLDLAEQTEAGKWQVTLDVRARKVVADEAGVETDVPMDEMAPIGLFAPGAQGQELGAPLYLEMHHVRSGEQTITVTVPHKPARAGIDPYHLLDWEAGEEDDDNIHEVEVEN